MQLSALEDRIPSPHGDVRVDVLLEFVAVMIVFVVLLDEQAVLGSKVLFARVVRVLDRPDPADHRQVLLQKARYVAAQNGRVAHQNEFVVHLDLILLLYH